MVSELCLSVAGAEEIVIFVEFDEEVGGNNGVVHVEHEQNEMAIVSVGGSVKGNRSFVGAGGIFTGKAKSCEGLGISKQEHDHVKVVNVEGGERASKRSVWEIHRVRNSGTIG